MYIGFCRTEPIFLRINTGATGRLDGRNPTWMYAVIRLLKIRLFLLRNIHDFLNNNWTWYRLCSPNIVSYSKVIDMND